MSTDEKEEKLLEDIASSRDSGEPVDAILQTDERVLARISDGIYRQPASALRELIANAFDADATRVVVKTDAPRFGVISVEDNGAGMSERSLVRLIHHIGGSAKRTDLGASFGITSSRDSKLSPKGRRLIGKIGIGLFSVAQLTRTFRILTKRAGVAHRLVAEVELVTFSEERPPGEMTRTGSVRIRSVPARPSEHGTKIELTNIQPPAREYLQSHDIWLRVYAAEEQQGIKFGAPPFHIGRLDAERSETIKRTDEVPWSDDDEPEERFRKLYDAVQREREKRTANPKLEDIFDRYLLTLWSLSLALPLPYLDGLHPFDVPGKRLPKVFQLSNANPGQATEVTVGPRETLRTKLGLEAAAPTDFEVLFDGVALRRPIELTQVIDERRPPLLFVGTFNADLTKLPANIAGGSALTFESYFLWTPKVVPVEHIGLLVRIAEASGTLFDPTYFSYQVAEKVRLRQLTGELFALQGLDAALNIDRESFNFGHPHAKIVSGWVHRALRQVANAQKRVQGDARQLVKEDESKQTKNTIWKIVKDGLGRSPERVQLVPDEKVEASRAKGNEVVSREAVLGVLKEKKGANADLQLEIVEARIAAIATLLYEYGLLEELDYDDQAALLGTIARILEVE